MGKLFEVKGKRIKVKEPDAGYWVSTLSGHSFQYPPEGYKRAERDSGIIEPFYLLYQSVNNNFFPLTFDL